ncbi:MAG: helix-turn-helix domain-containing protein [archaeon]|nr:helix-turn-helix domain-containing protein [archaeon]
MEQELRQSGLTGNEAKVYLALLKSRQISGSRLAKKTGLDRSVTYNVLDNLIEKGLVNYVIKDGKKIFSAGRPENLLTPVKEKEDFITSIIPKLKKVQKVPEAKGAVEVYEGKEGLKSFTLDVLRSDEFYILNATGRIFTVLEYFGPRIIRKGKKKAGIRIIANEESKDTDLMRLNAEIRFLPKEHTNSATTFIYGDKVAFQIITEKPIIVVIESKTISEGYKTDFEFIWKYCSKG